MVLMGGAILLQIFRIQGNTNMQGITGKGTVIPKTYYPARGEIYDRYGHLLAGNKTVYEIGLDLTSNPDIPTILQTIQGATGLDSSAMLQKITAAPAGTKYIVLKDFVAADKAAALLKLQDAANTNPNATNLDSVYLIAHPARSYPENDLASNLLGFVTEDNHGYLGIEEKYDNILAGLPVTMLIPADPRRATELPTIPPGQTLILTIDRELQASVEHILDSALQDTGAASGTIIVMNPRNGEILAMSSTPRMNLNDYTKISEIFPGDTPFDRAISQAYEPGSVMKILTMSSAIDKGTVQPGTVFLDTGSITVGGFRIVNWNNGAWGYQDMTSCLANSLNVCLAWVSTQMGNDVFYSYLQRFGLGHSTGIDLAGEVPGRLKLPGDGDWSPVDLGTNAFGQGVSVTPIQMVTAASALANDGKEVYPHILLAQVQNGHQSNTSVQVVGTPISAESAHTISDMLANALETESSGAIVPGYRIAGKTGTAQIWNPVEHAYDANEVNTSFIGWGPVDDPRFLVYVWLEKPQTNRAASVVAAPIFKQVVEKVIVQLNIPPDAVRLATQNGQ
jgi:cell division protein FtsI/penicillin-binding protein 2